jgi:hypothetical protein
VAGSRSRTWSKTAAGAAGSDDDDDDEDDPDEVTEAARFAGWPEDSGTHAVDFIDDYECTSRIAIVTIPTAKDRESPKKILGQNLRTLRQ